MWGADWKFCQKGNVYITTESWRMMTNSYPEWRNFNLHRTTMMDSFSCIPVLDTYRDRFKRIWYLSPMRAAKVQASLHIRAVSPEPPLLAHTSSESRGTIRQKARSLAPLNGWACAVKACHDGMLEDTNSLDGAHIKLKCFIISSLIY